MEVPLVLLADYANLSQEGKLNVLGIFNVVFVRSLPGGLPVCHLITRFVATPEEIGTTHQVEIKLIDPDARDMVTLSVGIQVPAGNNPGPVVMDVTNPINWLHFQRYGPHRIRILVDGEEKNSIEVIAAPPPLQPADRNA